MNDLQIKALDFEYKADTSKRTFEGYASTWEKDLGNDIIEKDAFIESIEQKMPKNRIKVLWQHFEPLGIPTHMEEDSKGLYVVAKVAKTRLGDEALELMADKVVDQLSIGYSIKEEGQGENGERILKKLDLFEFSPVTFPMNEGTSIETVRKSRFPENASLEEMKALMTELKEGRALSKKNAQKIQDAIKNLQAVLADAGTEKESHQEPDKKLYSFEALINEMKAYSKGAK